jgi:hypothetical protein
MVAQRPVRVNVNRCAPHHRKRDARAGDVPKRIGATQMDQLIAKLSKLDIVKGDFDLHFVRATMIIVFYLFGCQKWFDYDRTP